MLKCACSQPAIRVTTKDYKDWQNICKKCSERVSWISMQYFHYITPYKQMEQDIDHLRNGFCSGCGNNFEKSCLVYFYPSASISQKNCDVSAICDNCWKGLPSDAWRKYMKVDVNWIYVPPIALFELECRQACIQLQQ
jgi:hypothetical protein